MAIHVPNNVLQTTMDVVLRWGPDRIIPEPERIRQVHPNLSDGEVQEARNLAYAVLTEASQELAALLKEKQISRGDAVLQLQSNRPWLTEDQALQAINQGEYYFWRENG